MPREEFVTAIERVHIFNTERTNATAMRLHHTEYILKLNYLNSENEF